MIFTFEKVRHGLAHFCTGGKSKTMLKSWTGESKYILLVLITFLFVPTLYAETGSTPEAKPPGLKDSPVCKLLSAHFDRPRSLLERDFGPVISSKRKGPAPSHGSTHQVLTIEFAQHVSVTYVTDKNDSKGLLIGVEAKGKETLRKLGLDVNSFEDVQSLLGKPDSVEGNVMNYSCDIFSDRFSIDPTSYSVSVSLHTSVN